MADNEKAENGDVAVPTARTQHAHEDKVGQKYLDTSNKVHSAVEKKMPQSKQPAGGFDSTPFPSAPPGYTVKFTFHKATHLPFADVNTLSSDPYVLATLKTSLPKRHKEDPDLKWRTPTIRRNTNPEWNSEWIVANVPASGFELKCRLYDEDPADKDDRLGNAHIVVNSLSEQWSGIDHLSYKVKKRMGSKRAYLVRGCASLLRGGKVEMSGHLVVSVQVLGKTQSDEGGHIYTVGPKQWTRHYSPLIGRLAGTKDTEESKDGRKSTEKYNFQAVQIQLSGPVPSVLYHRYVEFKPFVAGMFNHKGLRGWVLNRALHHQHARIYNYDRSTKYGSFEEPCLDMTKMFLNYVNYDQGGRIFTYVITLDGQWRFTETGKEFGIDMLSKHTMHADVDIYIAFSGEFFIRRLKHPHRDQSSSPDPESAALPPAPDPEDEGPDAAQPVKDPHYYELIIDNDSGTYRPNAKYLPVLKEFISKNLPGLRVKTLDCQKDEEEMTKLKDHQREKKKMSGKQMTYMQNLSGDSLSSSDEEQLDGVRGKGKAKQAAQQLKHPRAALMSAAADAAGPDSAVDHSKNEKDEEKEDQAKETTQTEEKPADGIPESGANEKTATNETASPEQATA